MNALILLLAAAMSQVQPAAARLPRPRRVTRGRRAIVDAPIIPANDVTNQVTDNELVLGVVVGGEARAYPINMLTGPDREIINDTLGKRPIAATW